MFAALSSLLGILNNLIILFNVITRSKGLHCPYLQNAYMCSCFCL